LEAHRSCRRKAVESPHNCQKTVVIHPHPHALASAATHETSLLGLR
jgi:hypothetical protein